MTKLSEHFSLEELCRTQTGLPNTPSEDVLETAKEAAQELWEPIRHRWGALHVTSGYRSADVNAAVNGSATSDHIWGPDACAIDFQPKDKNVSLETVYHWIRLESGLEFDQCFLERGKAKDSELDDCIHISYRKVSPRRQAGQKPTGGHGHIEWDEVI